MKKKPLLRPASTDYFHTIRAQVQQSWDEESLKILNAQIKEIASRFPPIDFTSESLRKNLTSNRIPAML